MLECREIVDTVKAEAKASDSGEGCRECMELQAEFSKNPGGRPPKRVGLIIAGVVGSRGCITYLQPYPRCGGGPGDRHHRHLCAFRGPRAQEGLSPIRAGHNCSGQRRDSGIEHMTGVLKLQIHKSTDIILE